MLKILFFILILFTGVTINAQPSQANMLRLLAVKCDSLGKAQQFEKERVVAIPALGLIDPSDNYNLSLFNYYIGYTFEGYNADTAVQYLETSLAYAYKAGNTKRISDALTRLMFLYDNNKGYLRKRDSMATILTQFLDTLSGKENKAPFYGALAHYYSYLGYHEKEMEYHLQTLQLFKDKLQQGRATIEDTANFGITYLGIGELYLVMKQPLKALQYTQQARAYLYNFPSGLCYYYKDITQNFITSRQLGNAKIYYDSLTQLLITKKVPPGRWSNRVEMDLALADYYLSAKNTDSALYFAKLAKTTCENHCPSNSFLVAQINYMTAKALVLRQDYNGALSLLKIAERLGNELDLETNAGVFKSIAECYTGLEQWQQATSYYRKYVPLRDSLYTESSKISLADAEAKYQNKEKQQKIELQQAQLAFSHKQRWWLVGGVLFFFILAALLLIVYVNKKRIADLLNMKNKDLEEANNTKAKLFGIISHDLRSPINQVYQFLKLQQMSPQIFSESEKKILNSKIQMATGSLLETMEDLLLWSKTQLGRFTPVYEQVLLLPLVSQCCELLSLNIETKNIYIENNIPSSVLVNTDPYFLQTIVRNLLQNAVKAAEQDSAVEIDFSHQLKSEKPCAVLSITNHGQPFTQQQYEQIVTNNDYSRGLEGLGLKVVHELSQKIDTEIVFETGETDEVKVSIMLNQS